MNIEYKPILTDYYKSLNFYLKNTGKEIPCKSKTERTQDFLNLIGKEIERLSSEDLNKAGSSAILFDSFVKDLNKSVPHIFIEDKNLLDFFKNIEIKDTKLTENLIDIKENSEENKISYYALHTPEESYMITLIQPVLKDSFTNLFVFDDKGNYTCIKFDGSEMKLINKDVKAKLGINFLSYINAFPECLKEGVPQNITKKDKEKYHNIKVLETSSHVLEIEQINKSGSKVIIPHFRKGHFRYLKDDRYVNKKGQVIFVKASMVRGVAKTLKNKQKDKNYER